MKTPRHLVNRGRTPVQRSRRDISRHGHDLENCRPYPARRSRQAAPGQGEKQQDGKNAGHAVILNFEFLAQQLQREPLFLGLHKRRLGRGQR